MKCPVCKAETSQCSPCPACGFDPTQDYEAYPSLAPLTGGKPLSALRAAWREKNNGRFFCPKCGKGSFSFYPREQSLICEGCGFRVESFSPDGLGQTVSLLRGQPASDAQIHRPASPSPDFEEDPEHLLTFNDVMVISYEGGLANLALPESVQHIWDKAFEGRDIHRIRLPAGLQILGNSAFSHSALEEIELPDGLKRIPCRAFYACKKLRLVRLPSSLLSIEEYAFRGCSELRELILPNCVRNIAENAFLDCPRLTLRATEAWSSSHRDMLNAVCARSKVAFLSL